MSTHLAVVQRDKRQSYTRPISSPSPYTPSPARSENLGIRSPNGQKPKLLDQVREAIRTRHYSWRTEQTYVQWIKRFIFFHEKKHPLAMGGPEVTRFLSALAVEQHVSAATQSQALSCCFSIVTYSGKTFHGYKMWYGPNARSDSQWS